MTLGDYDSDKFAVKICPPPFVEDGHIEVSPPAYTELRASRSAIKNLQVPEGSTVTIVVKPNAPVAKGELLEHCRDQGIECVPFVNFRDVERELTERLILGE